MSRVVHRSDTAELVQLTLGDFRILHSELQFGGTLVDTETGGIHTGRWTLSITSTYGTINIHTTRTGGTERSSYTATDPGTTRRYV